MNCESIEIVNFCQYEYRMHTFGKGLTAIIGPNGSGKSNFLGAIRFALTGDNPNAGAKAANIFDRAPADQNSYVSMVFTHGGVRATVRRNLRPARPTAVLTIDGGEQISGDEKVTAMIEEILGVTTDIINDIIVVAQSDIFGFLDKTPAKRAEQFQRLFHTEKAAAVYKAIGNQISTMEIPSVGVDLDVLRVQVQAARESVQSHTQDLEQLPEYKHIKEQIAANVGVVQNYDRREQLTGQRDRLVSQFSERGRTNNTIQAQRHASAVELQTIEEAKLQNTEPSEQAATVLNQLGTWRRNNVARQRQLQVIEAASAQIVALVQPVKPDGYVDSPDILRPEYEKLNAEVLGLVAFITSFDGDVGECPTCGTEASVLQPKLVEATIRLPIATELKDKSSMRHNVSTQYNLDKTEYDHQLQVIIDRQDQARRTLNDLPKDENTNVDEKKLQSKIDTQLTLTSGIAEYKQILINHDRELARLDGSINEMAKQLATLEKSIAELPTYVEVQRHAASNNVAGWERAELRRREVDLQLTAAHANLQQGEHQLAQAEQVEIEAGVLRDWATHGLAMREVVHKDGAPRFVAQRNLQRLQVGMNEFLEMFDTNYRVTADEGLSFTASFTTGSKQPAARLSEGQKVVLALAFRLALNRMFAENVGALYLDEPTAYLDEHHIRGFEPVLGQLREFSASRGLQCMIVTHECDLAPLFDSVIQL